MPFPISALEWEPAASGSRQKRVYTLSTDGASDTDNQSNYHIYRWNAFDSIELTGTLWEVGAFWNSALKAVIATRSGGGGAWTLTVLDGTGGKPDVARTENDNHNNVNLSLDSTGIIHLWYDHHNVALNYRKSTNPVSSFDGTFGAEGSMVGTNESAVAYCTGFRDPLGVLYCLFRDGTSGNGDAFIYKYTTGAGTWAALGGTTVGKVVDGKGSTGVQNPYWHGPPEFTSDWDGAGTGFMYFGWIWRNSTDAQTNHDVSCVRWNGLTTWTHTDGSAQTMPVTLSNCDIANAVPENSNLTGFNALVLDSNNRPHLIQTYEDPADSDFSKISHTYWNGSAWVNDFVAGGSGFQFGQNGPDAVIDADDTLRIIVCHATGVGNALGIYAYVAASPWSSWSLESLIISDTTVVEGSNGTNVGGHHDRYLWETYGIYRMMVPVMGHWPGPADIADIADEDFAAWGGYTEATADAPASAVEKGAILKISLDTSHTAFWGAVDAAGDDVRVTDGAGNQLARDLAEWNYPTYALIHVWYPGDIITAPTVRIYAGNAGASAPADDATFGRENTYPSWVRGYWPAGGGTDRTGYDNDFTMTGSPTLGSGNGAMGQSCYEFNGSSQYGQSAVSVPTVHPVNFFARFNADSDTALGVIASIANNAVADSYQYLSAAGTITNDPIRVGIRAPSQPAVSADKIGYTANTWQHAGGAFASITSRRALHQGVAGTPETTSRTPTSQNRIAVGVLITSTPSSHFDGEICDLWLSTILMTDAAFLYESTQGDQATFWNGWAWTSQGGGGIAVGSVFRSPVIRGSLKVAF